MNKDTYLVLRVTAAAEKAFDPLATRSYRTRTAAVTEAAVDYRVDSHTLDHQDYRELRRDPQVAAIARPMALKLIQPVAAPAPSAAGARSRSNLGHPSSKLPA